jgi:hypothetical protein
MIQPFVERCLDLHQSQRRTPLAGINAGPRPWSRSHATNLDKSGLMALMGVTAVGGLPMGARTRTGAQLQHEGMDAKCAACSTTRGGGEPSHRRGLSGL